MNAAVEKYITDLLQWAEVRAEAARRIAAENKDDLGPDLARLRGSVYTARALAFEQMVLKLREGLGQ